MNMPMLGGFHWKAAGAYLLPPAKKPKKKKQTTPPAEEVELAKAAADLAEQLVWEKCAELRRRLQACDLGGGWNPHDQIVRPVR